MIVFNSIWSCLIVFGPVQKSFFLHNSARLCQLVQTFMLVFSHI